MLFSCTESSLRSKAFSCGTWAFSSHGVWLSCSIACGILVLGPGIKPVFLALADGFLTPGPLAELMTWVLMPPTSYENSAITCFEFQFSFFKMIIMIIVQVTDDKTKRKNLKSRKIQTISHFCQD